MNPPTGAPRGSAYSRGKPPYETRCGEREYEPACPFSRRSENESPPKPAPVLGARDDEDAA